MEKTLHDKVFLIRDGQSQKGRYPDALQPSFAKIDDRGLSDFLEFARVYAKELNYFNNENVIEGDWTCFFDKAEEEILSQLQGYGKHPPHLALYIAFLQLMQYPQKELNGITERHLDFYYRKVLGLTEKPFVPDKIHLVLELKKEVQDLLLKKGTSFKAGKDSIGKELLYTIVEDTIINRAKVVDLRSLFVNPVSGLIYIAPKAASIDGLGGVLNKNAPQWDGFGAEAKTEAEIGFALASPVLLLAEGKRKIDITLTLSQIESKKGVECPVEILLTGPKGWLGPKEASLNAVTGFSGIYTFSITLQADEPAIVSYAPKTHGGNFGTNNPIMQILLKKEGKGRGYRFLKSACIVKLKIAVDVSGMSTLALENDAGGLDATKPFMPFGPNPETGSAFYIGCAEALGKDLTELSLDVQWKVPETNLASYYSDYKSTTSSGTLESIVSSNSYFTADLITTRATFNNMALFGDAAGAPVSIKAVFGTTEGRLKTRSGKSSALKKQHTKWSFSEVERMSLTDKGLILSENNERISAGLGSGDLKKGFVELRLNRSFLHKEYREIYTKNIVTFAAGGGVGTLVLPKEPYTPVMKSIRLNYKAATDDEDITTVDEGSFLCREIEFFHMTAYGQMRDDGYLRKHASFTVGQVIPLLPQYRNEGELYIGVKEIEPLQNLSLLFQVAEGTADPATDKANINWSILSDNYWRPFTETEILSDGTNSLLKSGIMRFVIPQAASYTNTVLPEGCFWLRATIGEHTDGVCKFIDVRANVSLAVFSDQGNDSSYLASALPPKSISGPVGQIDEIKGVEQPFASFGGAIAENSSGFYTRVSERLRHKNRAVTIWDCERMVLEHFPGIYKVKCISHTSPDSLIAPGHLTVVVVPNMKNRLGVNLLKPKVDKETLIKIRKFLNDHTGYFTHIDVENPVYEEVKVAFHVVFHKDYEFGHYRSELNRELVAHLTPWAYDQGKDIVFGGHIHKSVILDFVEDRSYVDYVTRFRMFQGASNEDKEMIQVSGPRSVLVSVANHTIEPG
jgi:hypothetical protein